MGGYFDAGAGTYISGAEAPHEGAGTPAGVRAREGEPMARRGLAQAAKSLVPPAGPREPSPSPFDGWGTKAERRELQRAAEFAASMGDQAGQLGEYLDAEQADLAASAGELETGEEESHERIGLVNALADSVDTHAAELVEDQREFLGWAAAEAGGEQELLDWLGEQDDQQGALQGLAEEFVAETQTDEAFTSWVASAIGEEGIAQIDAMDDEDRTEVLGDLADAFADEHGLTDGGDFEDEDEED